MRDIAEITKQAHDSGFEQGSMAAVNLILAWLTRSGHEPVARDLLADWDDGNMTGNADIAQPKMHRDEARGKGFTGNSCVSCGSMEMQIAGHCEVCSSCGTTTGCS